MSLRKLQAVRLELTLTIPAKPDASQLQALAAELEAGLNPNQWEALLAVSRAVVSQAEGLQVHHRL